MTEMTFDELVGDFEFIDDWEERYKYLIELGRLLPAFDDKDRTAANKVHGCVSQVWLKSEVVRDQEDKCRLVFSGDSDALIVKGLIFVLVTLMSNRELTDVANMDAHSKLQRLSLAEHLTPQRSNGLAAMIQRIKTLATKPQAGREK
jgi:cysteine desulfuration protein SufE